MTLAPIAAVTITLDGGPETPGRIDEACDWFEAMVPDRTWQHTDTAGHWHAFDDDGQLPTLVERRRHVPCDGSCGCDEVIERESCEGYDVTEQRCRICDAVVEPKWASGSKPGPRDWTGEVYGYLGRIGDRVLVKAITDHVVLFGVALVVDVEVNFNQESITRLSGDGPLGRRKQTTAQANNRALSRELATRGYRPGTPEHDGAMAAARAYRREMGA